MQTTREVPVRPLRAVREEPRRDLRPTSPRAVHVYRSPALRPDEFLQIVAAGRRINPGT